MYFNCVFYGLNCVLLGRNRALKLCTLLPELCISIVYDGSVIVYYVAANTYFELCTIVPELCAQGPHVCT